MEDLKTVSTTQEQKTDWTGNIIRFFTGAAVLIAFRALDFLANYLFGW